MAKSKIDKSKGVILKYDIVHGVADLPASDGPDLDLRAINAELMTEFGFSDRLALTCTPTCYHSEIESSC